MRFEIYIFFSLRGWCTGAGLPSNRKAQTKLSLLILEENWFKIEYKKKKNCFTLHNAESSFIDAAFLFFCLEADAYEIGIFCMFHPSFLFVDFTPERSYER